MGKSPSKQKKKSKKEPSKKKKAPSKKRKEAKNVNWLSIVLISVGLCLIFIATTILSIILIFKYDLINVLDLNMGKVEAAEIIYDTYTYNIDEVTDTEISTDIIEALGLISFNGVNRFELDETIEVPNFEIMTESDPEKCSESLAKYELLPVGHFYWVKDELKVSEISSRIFITTESNRSDAESILSAHGNETELIVVDTLEELEAELEKGEAYVGLISVDEITPTLKLLSYNGKYYLEDLPNGALQSCLAVRANFSSSDRIQEILEKNLKEVFSSEQQGSTSELSEESILSVRMTGVVALSRNLAIKIDQSGDPAYPAEKIGDFLAAADLTHTSNEVSFVEGCTPEQSMSFCSAPEYIEALKESGVDIVELTGNHNNDYGADNNRKTIEMYDDLGWKHFGGGYDRDDASEILYIDDSGTIIAFIGYNYFDSMLNSGAIAGESRAGANYYSSAILEGDVKQAREKADIVIVDFQFQECFSYPEDGGIYPICYRPLTLPDQKGTFRSAIDFGADIVIGTQAHQPQTYELYKDGVIFYGLGNLFFDQIPWIGTRQGIVLTHYFYKGEHMQTKIDTTLYGSDMQPYVSYGEDRELLLDLLYQAR